MIEDALKRARQSYFLVLAIAAITILFTSSIRKPDELVHKKEIVEELLSLDLIAYDRFVQGKVDSIRSNNNLHFLDELDSLHLLIFDIDNIKSALKDLDYSGRLYLENSRYENLSDCNFNNLIDINSLETKKNVQWFIPNTDLLEREIILFLTENNQTGARVTDISIIGDRNDSDISTYSALEDVNFNLNFSLISVDNSFSPVFTKPVFGDIVEIPSTSFENWLKTKRKIDSKLLSKIGDSLVWLKGEKPFTIEERQINFDQLLSSINSGLENYLPEKQSIKFLGLEISGTFFFIVSPILIILLIYFLSSNLSHLNNLFQIQSESCNIFKEFSWTALNGGGFKNIEILIVVQLFPIFSLTRLLWILFKGDVYSWDVIIFVIIVIVTCFILSQRIIKQFKQLNSLLNLLA